MAKGRESLLKAARKKKTESLPIRLSADFSAETMQARREWHDLKPRVLCPARLPFRTEREIKNFSDKQKLKEFISTKLTCKRNIDGSSLNG